MESLIRWLGLKPYQHLTNYMQRWWLVQAADGKCHKAARLHHILRSDLDRALHGHPWDNASLLLRGGYWEVVPGAYRDAFEDGIEHASNSMRELHLAIHNLPGSKLSALQREVFGAAGVRWRGPGSFTKRRAEDLHRLVVPSGPAVSTTASTVRASRRVASSRGMIRRLR
jgi:hypothetical protein